LANIAKLLGVGEKGTELVHFQGKWHLTDDEQRIMGGYCMNDVELTSDIFDALKGQFPPSELRLIDLTVRLFTEPALAVERGVLIEEYKRERRSKRALLKACNTDKTVLASGDKFAELLLTLGVDPPKKLSPSKVKDGRVDPDSAGEAPLGLLPSFKLPVGAGLFLSKDEMISERVRLKAEKDVYPWAYAFGKSDEAFKMLLDHPDPQVQAVVEARLGVKSTIKETRSKRFYKIGKRGRFPVYHNYYGARTGRDCLTGDTRIYVLRYCKVIGILLPDLRPNDLVWDGEEFVAHGGLAYRGKQEVITYDGITGTLAHQVFCEETPTAIALSAAAARGYKIKAAAPPPGYAGAADAVVSGGAAEPAKQDAVQMQVWEGFSV